MKKLPLVCLTAFVQVLMWTKCVCALRKRASTNKADFDAQSRWESSSKPQCVNSTNFTEGSLVRIKFRKFYRRTSKLQGLSAIVLGPGKMKGKQERVCIKKEAADPPETLGCFDPKNLCMVKPQNVQGAIVAPMPSTTTAPMTAMLCCCEVGPCNDDELGIDSKLAQYKKLDQHLHGCCRFSIATDEGKCPKITMKWKEHLRGVPKPAMFCEPPALEPSVQATPRAPPLTRLPIPHPLPRPALRGHRRSSSPTQRPTPPSAHPTPTLDTTADTTLGNIADSKPKTNSTLTLITPNTAPDTTPDTTLELEWYQRFLTAWWNNTREAFPNPIRDIVADWESFVNRLPTVASGVKGPWSARDRQAAKTLKLMSWNPNSYNLKRFLHRKDSKLRKRISWACYKKQRLKNKKLLVIGAGPGGLRLAIEARLNGADVTLLERRESFTRMNVLYIWEFSREDMVSLGIKDMWPKFVTSSDKMTVPIAYLQHALLRVALTLGVKVRAGCSFTSLVPAMTHTHWVARASCDPNASTPKTFVQEDFQFDAIADGTGARPALRSYRLPGKSKPVIPALPTMRNQAENFAITANFKRFGRDHQDQFALSYQYEVDKFDSKRVALMNIVYYRSPIAHYIVASIRKDSLLEQGVVRKDIIGNGFLSNQNIDQEALLRTASTIAEDWNIPHKDGFFVEGPDIRGKFKPSCYVFEFTKMMKAERSADIIQPPETHNETFGDSLFVDQARGSKCCCRPGRCRGSHLNRRIQGKVEIDNVPIDDSTPICCKPRAQACDTNKYSFPAPESLGFDGSCRSLRQKKCQLAVPGSTVREHGDMLTGEKRKTCKCESGMRLFGSSPECKGRKFDSNDLQGHGCSCKRVQPVLLVGDAALSPFWPEGTGANRAFLGAVQQTWNLANFFKLKGKEDNEFENVFLTQMDKLFSKLKSSQSDTCSTCQYEGFIKHGYDGDVAQDVCRPRGTKCKQDDIKSKFLTKRNIQAAKRRHQKKKR